MVSTYLFWFAQSRNIFSLGRAKSQHIFLGRAKSHKGSLVAQSCKIPILGRNGRNISPRPLLGFRKNYYKKMKFVLTCTLTTMATTKYRSESLSFCSDFRYESNGIFVLVVGFFFLQTNFDFLTSHF